MMVSMETAVNLRLLRQLQFDLMEKYSPLQELRNDSQVAVDHFESIPFDGVYTSMKQGN